MLTVEDISASYGEFQALESVRLRVDDGQVVALLGPNAAGKTTTLRAISGTVPVRSGEVTLDGQRLDGREPTEIVDRGVVQVPEGRRLFGTMTVRENLELGAYTPRARARRASSLEQVYTLFPALRERERQLARTLSGGEQQMCAIGRGLMAGPRLLMIDEMSLGLSPKLAQEMFALVTGIASDGTAVLIVEQHVQQALEVADYAFVIEQGRTRLEGTPQHLHGATHIKEAYLGM